MTTPELLTHILYELRTLRKELTTTKTAPRVFVPEDVRKALGADWVNLEPQGNIWRLSVWFDWSAGTPRPPDAVGYHALSSEGFSTAEAIEVIQKQRPTVPS